MTGRLQGSGGGVATTRPILPAADLERTALFYAGLGFDTVGHWPQEYLILSGPDGIELHFWHDPGVDRWTNDVGCWIGYRNPGAVRARHDAWAAAAVPAPAELRPVTAEGHLVEFQLIDLDGNLLRCGAPAAAAADLLSAPAADQVSRYGRVERERRFLLARPPDAATVTSARRITDRYLDGTRLRLRLDEPEGADPVRRKLTQKVPGPRAADGEQGLITTIYLDDAEFSSLEALPAAVLVKRRCSVPPFGVDVFAGVLTGLVLAEVEFDTAEACAGFVVPPDAPVEVVAEVTADPRFTGGRLARTSAATLTDLLREYGLRPSS